MATKPTLPTLTNTGNIQAQLTTINNGYRQIEDEFEKMLGREDNSLPNHMLDALDMDGNKVINVASGTEGPDAVNRSQLDTKEDSLGNPSANGMVLASTISGMRYWQDVAGGTAPTIARKFYFIDVKEALPSPSGGVITLEDNATYFFTTTIDLTGDRLVCGENTTILGGSSENCRIKSTGLTGIALITSGYSLPMRNITIEADVALNLNATGYPTGALDWFGVNFTNCATVGTIANYSNFIMTDCALLGSANMAFDGTIGTVGFNQCLFSGISGQSTIVVLSSATITRRFRMTYSAVSTPSTGLGIFFSASASVPVESYILDTVNFSGAGTALSGVAFSDNKALFTNCKGIDNTSSIANYYMSANATATNVISVNTPLKIDGATTASSINQKFSHSSNRATYVGGLLRDFKVSAVASVTAAASNLQIGFYVAKNGTVIPESEMYVTTNAASRAESVAIHTLVSLTTNDYIEIWVENDTNSTDVTVTYLNVIVESLN